MTSAFLFINAELLFIDDVITKLNEIVYTYKVQGIYDIIVRVSTFVYRNWFLKVLVTEYIRSILIKLQMKTNSCYSQKDRERIMITSS